MTGPKSTPQGEHVPRPGVTWQTTETYVDDDPFDTAGPDSNQPESPRLNRQQRRAMQRAARRTK